MSLIGQNHLPASPADFMKKCSDRQTFVLSPLFTVAGATEHFARQQSNEAYFSLGDLLARTKRHILKRKCQAIFRNFHTFAKNAKRLYGSTSMDKIILARLMMIRKSCQSNCHKTPSNIACCIFNVI